MTKGKGQGGTLETKRTGRKWFLGGVRTGRFSRETKSRRDLEKGSGVDTVILGVATRDGIELIKNIVSLDTLIGVNWYSGRYRWKEKKEGRGKVLGGSVYTRTFVWRFTVTNLSQSFYNLHLHLLLKLDLNREFKITGPKRGIFIPDKTLIYPS